MSVQDRLRDVRARIERAAEHSGRDPDEIRILAATKSRNVGEIMTSVEAGINLIGENTVQEALEKFEFLPQDLERHMIGTLQPNKVKAAVRLFDGIQSVTSWELAEAIDRQAQRSDARYPVLVEVNPAEESSKRGLAIAEARDLALEMATLENLRLDGFMAMMPEAEDLEHLRPYFQAMKRLFDTLNDQRDVEMTTLSMGMTHDYALAVEEGATLVRLGTSLFGPRET
ncbi:MAG: YggS family pyridoxal phosphate-dependent enzyme [Candidatus Bipolaricaulia bacterium]